MTLDSINSADPTKPTVEPVPYTGVQFVAIPEFAGIATQVGQEFSAMPSPGSSRSSDALEKAQALTDRRDGSRRLPLDRRSQRRQWTLLRAASVQPHVRVCRVRAARSA